MDGKDQLLSQEASCEANCNAIDAPVLLTQSTTAQEESNEPKIKQEQVNEMESSTIGPDCTRTYKENTEIEFNLKGNQNNPEKTKNEATKNKATKNKATKNETTRNETTKNETMKMYGDDNDGNNNSDEKEDLEKGECVRRARFSSEIRIEPKAYFQAGGDTVVTLPPASSDDVFQNETNHTSQNSPPVSSHVILNAKPFDNSHDDPPPTFLPLTLFSCLFCCPMIGLFAVYKSYRVNKLIANGEMTKAREASQHARQLGILTSLIGFFFVLAIIAIAVMVSELS